MNITRRQASIRGAWPIYAAEILAESRRLGLDKDLGVERVEPDDALAKLDNHLCEIKELQIRDGLHILGRAPEGEQLVDLLVALVRVPRGDGTGGDASILRALASDLWLGDVDPLDCDFSKSWNGPKPETLASPTRCRRHMEECGGYGRAAGVVGAGAGRRRAGG